jgi:DHA1 family inner membrane transport protein
MYAPFRLLATLRGSVETGLVLATAVATTTFVATPLILPAIAARFDVGTGRAGTFSAAQLGAFVISSWGAGRLVRPSRALFVQSLLVLAGANVASTFVTTFWLFVAARGAAGMALGVLTWLAYSQVFGDADRTGDIAVIGPLTGVAAAPLLGVVLATADDKAVFWLLAGLTLVPLLRLPEFVIPPAKDASRTRAVPQAFVLIAALGVVMFGGSAVFVYVGAMGVDQYGLDPFVISLVFSANAAVGIPSARWRGGRPLAGAWMLLPATFAVVIGLMDQPIVFWLLITGGGFCFWMSVPGIYTLLAERSRHPSERAGDAQAAMAAGRSLGPLLGGVLVGAGGFELLGVVGGVVIAMAALTIVVVELRH